MLGGEESTAQNRKKDYTMLLVVATSTAVPKTRRTEEAARRPRPDQRGDHLRGKFIPVSRVTDYV